MYIKMSFTDLDIAQHLFLDILAFAKDVFRTTKGGPEPQLPAPVSLRLCSFWFTGVIFQVSFALSANPLYLNLYLVLREYKVYAAHLLYMFDTYTYFC